MDLFLTLRNFDADGNEIMETGQQGTPVPVAKGWLRASHRELDPELSLPYRPYHKHTRRLFLKPGEIVKVDVEIWPTSMVFKKGHRIQLDVQPRDGVGSQSLSALSRRLQHRHQHDPCRRRVRVVSAAAGDSKEMAKRSECGCLAAPHVARPRAGVTAMRPEFIWPHVLGTRLRSPGAGLGRSTPAMRRELALMSDPQPAAKPSPWDILARADVLSGLLFIAIAAFGLWAVARLSGRHGAAHGHRLHAAAAVLAAARPRRDRSGAGLAAARPRRCARRRRRWRAVLSVTLSLVAFALEHRAARARRSPSCCSPASARWRRGACGRWKPRSPRSC